MGEIESYFFDTYAFFEIINGNPNYEKYSKGIAIVTTKLNLMELHYGLLASYGKETADKYFDKFIDLCIEIDDKIIKSANNFRYLFKKKKLSYIDCVGYILAKARNLRFLTGDMQFEDMENVEFVK